MKVLLLADPNVSHTIKWARSLSERDISILIVGLNSCDKSIYKGYKNIEIVTSDISEKTMKRFDGDFSKIQYMKILPLIRSMIRKFRPDILHAHYATSYGLMGALSGFNPFIISVWGNDVYIFPNRSFVHRRLLRYNLSRADKILSTSNVMAAETGKYTDSDVTVTPFGIDLQIFKKMDVKSLFNNNDIVIGTVKTLEEKYGIEYLIRAFKILKDKHPSLPLKLLIVGGGTYEKRLRELADDLSLSGSAVFTGRVPYDQVVMYHNMISINVSVSIDDSESFGVAIIEASACENPVVVSSVGGLPEVVEDGVTGFVVPPRDPEKTAEAIEKLVLDKDLSIRMGRAGRERVRRFYNWDDNVSQMTRIYNNIINGKRC